MGRRKHHHLEKNLKRSDLVNKNEATRGRNIPMQKNFDIILHGDFCVISPYNLLLPLPLTFLL